MRDSLTLVVTALDAAAAPVRFFIRDDDAGWDDASLLALLDCTARVGVPIDLAVVPDAVSPSLASELRARMAAASGAIGLHQHGFAHANHEATGRKCEFGPSRASHLQRRDLLQGRGRLRDHFGTQFDSIFTPPWNRCASHTPALLAAMGYAALSRDASAPAQDDLPELTVHVDWCKQRRIGLAQGDGSGVAIAEKLAGKIVAGATIGVMLHHAQMDAGDRALLDRWLPLWTRHPHARWLGMRDLINETRPHALLPAQV